MIRIKQKTVNVWEHTNGNIVNIAIIANVVHFLETSTVVWNYIDLCKKCLRQNMWVNNTLLKYTPQTGSSQSQFFFLL